MKRVIIQGPLGNLQEMVELDSGLVIPIEVAKKELDRQIKETENAKARALTSLYSRSRESLLTVN